MIDIHCHILPGVDDGSGSLEESLDMADLAIRSGIDTICVTPHVNLSGSEEEGRIEELEEAFSSLKRALDREGMPLKIVRGSEIYVDHAAVSRLKAGQFWTLNGTNHCLIEFPFDTDYSYIDSSVKDFLRAGYVPVVAHPERYYCVQEEPWLLDNILDLGIFLQVNKGSVLGRFGKDCEMCVDFLLDENMVSCIASDAHSFHMRTTNMREISDYLSLEYSREYRDKLMKKNPAKLLGLK